ncbi:MAG: thioredoxin [Planctomycetota bacterium]|nr:thioredoxin [Planctomycetota bacterium]
MSGATIDVTSHNFDQIVLGANVPVVVDFWASWCGPCARLAPVIEQLAVTMKEKAIFAKVDAETEETLARRYSISALPTLLLFHRGKVVDSAIGMKSKQEIESLVTKCGAGSGT